MCLHYTAAATHHKQQQYFFINSLFAVGTVFGMIGVTMHLRSEYNLFADPVAPLLFLIMFLSCDMLQRLLRRLADIQVNTLLWAKSCYMVLTHTSILQLYCRDVHCTAYSDLLAPTY
jgi:hypothetical protein